MAHFPAVIFLGLFLILVCSTYSAAGLPVVEEISPWNPVPLPEPDQENNVITK